MSTTFSAVDLEKGVRATLVDRLQGEAPVLVDKLCEIITDSQTDEEKHLYMSDAPQVEEFEGSRKHVPLLDKSTTIVNRVYDTSIRLRRDDLRRSQAGGVNITRQMNRLVQTVRSFPNKRLTDLMVSGTVAVATSGENTPYDGVPFFDDAHPAIKDEGGTQDNLLAGSGTSGANIATDLNTALSTFMTFKGTNGEPFFGDMDLQLCVVYPAQLDKPMREALNATIISNTTNVMTGLALPVSTGRFADVDDWYIFVTNPGWRPLIWQDDQNLEVDVTAEDSDLWKQDRQAEVGVSLAIGAGYGYWQSAIKFVN